MEQEQHGSCFAVVTTSRKPHAAAKALARETAARLSLPYVPRGTLSSEEVRARSGADCLLVARAGGLRLETPEGELFFHPNMSHLRVKNLRKGQSDHLVEAMGLTRGMSVLDGTLGFGADAIVASFVTGETGRVVGVEASPLIEAVVHDGLAHFAGENAVMTAAMRRIETHCADALAFLRAQPAKSFDVVYFDPMFRHPLLASENLNPLRYAADHRAATPELIAEARRVARHRVVMKETSKSGEFARLGFPEVVGGKYSPVHYGVLRVGETGAAAPV